MTATVDRIQAPGQQRAEAPFTLNEPPPRVLGFWDQFGLWANLGVSLLGPVGALGVLVLGLLLAPATMFGAWAGRHVVRRISERAFVLVVEVGLVVSALLLWVSP